MTSYVKNKKVKVALSLIDAHMRFTAKRKVTLDPDQRNFADNYQGIGKSSTKFLYNILLCYLPI